MAVAAEAADQHNDHAGGDRSDHRDELAKPGHARQQDRVGRSAGSQEEAVGGETGHRQQDQSANIFAQQQIDVFQNIVHHGPAAFTHQSRDKIVANARSIFQKEERENRNQHQVKRVLRSGDQLAAQSFDVGQKLRSAAAQLVLHMFRSWRSRAGSSQDGKRNPLHPAPDS